MSLILKIKSLRHKAYLAYCRKKPIQKNKIILWSDNFKSFEIVGIDGQQVLFFPARSAK